MKVVICGAGQVGTSIARHLAGENNDVTVIDQDPELIQKVGDTLDVCAVKGHASFPNVLEQAGLRDADMIIAVTYSDEVNMVACQIAHSLFNVPTKIARVRSQDYLLPVWADLFSRDNMPIDVIISPEREVAKAISRRLHVPGAIDVVPMAGGRVSVVGVRCTEATPIIDTPLRQLTSLFNDLSIVVVGLFRGGQSIVPKSDDQMLENDEVYFVCDTEHLWRALATFGHEEPEARSVVIAGGGNIGLTLAQEIERDHPGVGAKVIEMDRNRARFVAEELRGTIVLNGDVLDPDILEEAGVAESETFIAVSNDDEVNILSSLLAKQYGAERTVSLINASTYAPLITQLGIDTVVNPRALTVSSILQHVRRGRINSVYSVGEELGEVVEAEALETSPLVGSELRDAKIPAGVIIGAIARGDEVIMPRGDTIVRAGDRVVLFATYQAVKQVEKLFAVRLDFF